MIDRKLIPDDVQAVCRRLHQAGHQAHLVGGGVRDLLLGRPPADFDVATSAHPDDVMRLFGSRYAIPTGLQHGTVTVLAADRRPVEVTTFRGEGEYLDGRRPSSVRFGATLVEDLARRDFTMNAIAYDPVDDVLTDPFGGQEDLAAGLVRAVGDPVARFREDGLRPMRAVRQATQLDFTIEPSGYSVRFAARRVPATPARPRGISYALTMPAPDGTRLVGFDNAHGVRASRGPAGVRTELDHRHRLSTTRSYRLFGRRPGARGLLARRLFGAR